MNLLLTSQRLECAVCRVMVGECHGGKLTQDNRNHSATGTRGRSQFLAYMLVKALLNFLAGFVQALLTIVILLAVAALAIIVAVVAIESSDY